MPVHCRVSVAVHCRVSVVFFYRLLTELLMMLSAINGVVVVMPLFELSDFPLGFGMWNDTVCDKFAYVNTYL